MRSHGRGISYTVQFAPSVSFDSSDCKKNEPKGPEEKKKRRRKARKGKNVEKADTKEEKETKEEPSEDRELTLADVKFVWTYTKGERVSLLGHSLKNVTTNIKGRGEVWIILNIANGFYYF